MSFFDSLNFPSKVNAFDCSVCQNLATPDEQNVCLNSCTPNSNTGGNLNSITVNTPDNLPDTFGTGNFGDLLGTILGAALTIGAVIAFLYLIWGGIQWITSGGDKQALEDARNRITSAIIGLIVVAASWAIFQLVQNVFFGGTKILQ